MDSVVMVEVSESPSLKGKRNDYMDCCTEIQKGDEDLLTIKKEIVNYQEEFGEIVQKQELNDTREGLTLFEGDPPEMKIFLEKEEPLDNEYEAKNFSIVNDSPAEEDPSELKERIKLEDIEFQSVGPPSSTGMVGFKTDECNRDNLFHEEEMNFPVASDEFPSEEEDPLELNSSIQEGVVDNREEPSKEKNKCSIGRSGNPAESHRELEYNCKYCSKMFDCNSNLEIHLQVHRGKKPLTCEHCQKSFPDRSCLRIHLRRHTGEKPFKCELCQKNFSHLGHFKSHLKTHTGERPFTCEQCLKSFARPFQLKIHLRTHTGEKPFSCELCLKAFPVYSSLRRHVRIHNT